MQSADVIIIGGGIVGLATAYQLSGRYPNVTIIVLEKEARLAQHQTGHNSGVLHSGIYYKPGSLKARNCRDGKWAMEAFCGAEDIDYDICGKVIVATAEHELPALETIYQRGQANGVQCEMIGPERLRELEPHAAGIKAIHVPESGIVNYGQVCERLAQRVTERGNQIVCGAEVVTIVPNEQHVVATTPQAEYHGRYLINCAGLHSDRVAALSGQDPQVKIVPFRGEYFTLTPQAQHLCNNLIYPVPDPAFPFLGVHFTRMIDGTVECGPNAVLALGRESYSKFQVHFGDLRESLGYAGFQKMAAKHWKMGLGEIWRSYNKAAFVKALQRLIPAIKAEDLVAAPSGIRAQAVTPDGRLVDDFLILQTERVINVCNAPSPAATASLNIGKTIVDRLAPQMEG